MMKKILVISTSWREGGNSDVLADEFAKGAKESGNEVEKINIAKLHIECCRGCSACQKTRKCIIQDDVSAVLEKMYAADVIAFATPVYYYGMCGQMKLLLDRTYPLFMTEYAFRDIYLLASGGAEPEETVQGTITGLEGWICCHDKAKLTDVIFAGGVMEKGEIAGHPALGRAYQAGKNV